MCNCIENINKELKEYRGDPEAHLDITTCIDLSKKPGEKQKLKCYPRIIAYIRPKKKDGTYLKEKQVVIKGEYCPFCGNKYEEDK
jgi:hypothetical protein